MILLSALVFGWVVATAGGGARAEMQISQEIVKATGGKTSSMTMYFAADRLKMDLDKIAIIYREDTGAVISVMKDQHKYMVIDPAAQQRMAAMMPAAQESKPSSPFEKTGKSKTVGPWSCQVFRKSLANGMTIEACFALLSAIGLTHDDMTAFKGLTTRMQKALPKFGDGNNMNFEEQAQQIGFEGLPVETVTSAQGVTQTTSIVKSVQHVSSLPPDTFELPAGYAKQEMPSFGK